MRKRLISNFFVICRRCMEKSKINFHGLKDGFLWTCLNCGTEEKVYMFNDPKTTKEDYDESTGIKKN